MSPEDAIDVNPSWIGHSEESEELEDREDTHEAKIDLEAGMECEHGGDEDEEDDWYHHRERRRHRHVEAPDCFDKEYTVNQVIERLGMTQYHYKMCMVVIVMTLLGRIIFEFFIMDFNTFFPKVLSQDYDRFLAPLNGVTQIVVIFSFAYWGWLADKYGLKNAIKMMLIILIGAMLLAPFCFIGTVTAYGMFSLCVFFSLALYAVLNVLVMEFLPHKHTFGFFMIVQSICPALMRGLLYIRGSPPALNLAILAILGFSFSMYQLYLLLRMIEQSPKHVVLQPNGRRRAKRIAMSMIQSTKYQVGPKFEIRGSGYKQISLFSRTRVSRVIWQRMLIFIGIFMVNLLAWAYIVVELQTRMPQPAFGGDGYWFEKWNTSMHTDLELWDIPLPLLVLLVEYRGYLRAETISAGFTIVFALVMGIMWIAPVQGIPPMVLFGILTVVKSVLRTQAAIVLFFAAEYVPTRARARSMCMVSMFVNYFTIPTLSNLMQSFSMASPATIHLSNMTPPAVLRIVLMVMCCVISMVTYFIWHKARVLSSSERVTRRLGMNVSLFRPLP